jgi:acetoin utilization deacetylase AcuC-like enzyme
VLLIVSEPTGQSGHNRTGHPERPERIAAALAGIEDLDLGSDLHVVPTFSADRAQLGRVHTASYLDELEAFCRRGGGDLDPDTYATTDSWNAACQSAGAGLAAIERLQHEEDGVAFVATRPPGHHALSDRPLGFCLLNNIAVAAAALAEVGERVLIVDWDVHHGNGTQEIFWDNPNVLYVSTHQTPLFPGTGAARQIGGPNALGYTVNVPLPPGATGDVMRRAIDEVALPVIDDFTPTWVLVSAGFDAHRDDPLANLALSSADFADLARVVAGFVPQPGRLVLFLEGGYDLKALRRSVASCVSALLGGQHRTDDPTTGGPGTAMVVEARAARIAALRQAQQLSIPGGSVL